MFTYKWTSLIRRRVDLESEIGCKFVSIPPNTNGKAGSTAFHYIAYELADTKLMRFYFFDSLTTLLATKTTYFRFMGW